MDHDTTSEWLNQAISRLPDGLHPAARAFARTINLRALAGEPYIDNAGLLIWLDADRDADFAGLNRLVALGWVIHDGDRFTPGATDSPVSGGGYPRGMKTRARNAISRKRRNAAYVRDAWVCWLCGLPAVVPTTEGQAGDWDAVVDHVVPHCEGGSDDLSNLRTAHSWCNMVRGARPAPVRSIQRARVVNRLAEQFADFECGYTTVEPPELFPVRAK